MKVTLTRTRTLSDEHPMSSYDRPVLVNRITGEVWGPGDLEEAYAFWGLLPASRVVGRLAKTARLSAEERALVTRCTGGQHPR